MKLNQNVFSIKNGVCTLTRAVEHEGEVYDAVVTVPADTLSKEIKQVLKDKMEQELNKQASGATR